MCNVEYIFVHATLAKGKWQAFVASKALLEGLPKTMEGVHRNPKKEMATEATTHPLRPLVKGVPPNGQSSARASGAEKLSLALN